MIIDIGAGTKSVNFHKGGGKGGNRNKAVKYNTKEWWQMLINCREADGYTVNGSLLYFDDVVTNEFYTESELSDFYDNEGNKIDIYTADGQKIVRHTKFYDNTKDASIFFSDNVIQYISFPDLFNGLSERYEIARYLGTDQFDMEDGTEFRYVLVPVYGVAGCCGGDHQLDIAAQKRLPILMYYNAERKEIEIPNIKSEQENIFLFKTDNTTRKSTVMTFDEVTLHPFNLPYNYKENYNFCLGNETLGEYNIDENIGVNGGRLPNFFRKINKITVADDVTDLSYMFYYLNRLLDINLEDIDTSKVTDMSGMFYESGFRFLDISNFDTTSLKKMNNFYYGYDLEKLILSSKFFNSTSLTTYDFSGARYWTEETSLATLVDALPQLTTTKTIRLSPNTKNALTDEQKTTITDKGWTIA